MSTRIGSRKSLRRALSVRCAPEFELLECRQLLAADVQVEVIAGSLVITGDDGSSYITVSGTGTAGELVINPGDLNTTVNGDTVPFHALGVTKDVRVDMMGGDDNIFMSNATGLRSFSYTPGSGNKTIRLSNFVFSRSISVKTLGGDDSFMIDSTTTPAKLTVDSGGGNDSFIIQDCTLSKGVSVRTGSNGSSPSNVNINNSTINGSVLAWHDSGDFIFGANNSNISGDVRLVDAAGQAALTAVNTTIGRHLKIAFGTGEATNDHQVLITNSSVGRNVTISSVSTQGYFSFDGVTIGGGFLSRSQSVGSLIQFYNSSTVAKSVRAADAGEGGMLLIKGANVGSVAAAADGGTQITLDNTFGATTVRGGVSVRSTNGVAQLTANSVTVEGLTSVKSVNKQETSAYVFADNSTFAGLKASAGLGALGIVITSTSFSKPMTLVGGRMADGISLNDSTFGARVVLSTGDGNDSVDIQTAGAAPDQTIFVRGLVAKLGAGDDTFVAGTSGNPAVVLEGTSSADGGSGVNTFAAFLDPASLPLTQKNFV